MYTAHGDQERVADPLELKLHSLGLPDMGTRNRIPVLWKCRKGQLPSHLSSHVQNLLPRSPLGVTALTW